MQIKFFFTAILLLLWITTASADVISIATSLHQFIGHENGDMAGSKVINAGDVNKDGYQDILIGAPNSSTIKGKVYLVLGKSSLDFGRTYLLSNTASSFMGYVDAGQLGKIMAGNGDLNGDQYPDFIFTSYLKSKVDLFLGKSAAYGNNIPALYPNSSFAIDLGSSNTTYFGQSLSMGGDINGDGYDDLLIGAPKASSSGSTNSTTYLYYGNATPIANLTTVERLIPISGQKTNDQSGYAVAIIPDINKDGYDDILITSYPTDGSPGSVYLFYGKRDAFSAMSLDQADAVFTISQSGTLFGTSVVGLGDINGDGYGDFALCAPAGGPNHHGAVYIYYGRSDRFPTQNNVVSADAILVGATSSEFAGEDGAVANAGDLNGDLLNDIVIGVPRDTSDRGKAYVVYGSTTQLSGTYDLSTLASQIYTGETIGDRAGTSVSSAGDMDGDGIDELLIGVPYFGSTGKSKNGKVALLQVAHNTLPTTVSSISILNSHGQSISQVMNRDELMIEVHANDPNPSQKNIIIVQAYSDTYSKPINVRLLETASNSGIYRGKLYVVRSRNSAKLNQVSAALGDHIYVAKDTAIIVASPVVVNAPPFVTNIVPSQVGIGNDTIVRLDYYLYDYDNNACNFMTDATQVQYRKEGDTAWTNIGISGKTSAITSFENGKAHTGSFEPLNLLFGNIDGRYFFRLKPHDGSQYATAYAETLTAFYIDNTKPQPPILSQPPDSYANQITVTGSAEANASVRIYVGNTLAQTVTVNSQSYFEAFPISVTQNNRIITAVCVDQVGNISSTSNSVEVTFGSVTRTIRDQDMVVTIQLPKDSIPFDAPLKLAKIPTATIQLINGDPPNLYEYLTGFDITFDSTPTLNASLPLVVSVSFPNEVRVTSSVRVWIVTGNYNLKNKYWSHTGITLNAVSVSNNQTTVSFSTQQLARFIISDPIDPYPPVITSIQLDNTDIVTNNYYAAQPVITLKAKDLDSGIGGYSLKIFQKGVVAPVFTFSSVDTMNIKELVASVTLNVALSDGIYAITATAWDHSVSENIGGFTSSEFNIAQNTFCFFALHAPNPFNPNQSPLTIAYNLNQSADVHCYILSQSGTLVYDVGFTSTSSEGSAGYHLFTWDGKNKFGNIMPNGLYYGYLTAKTAKDFKRVKLKIALIR